MIKVQFRCDEFLRSVINSVEKIDFWNKLTNSKGNVSERSLGHLQENNTKKWSLINYLYDESEFQLQHNYFMGSDK